MKKQKRPDRNRPGLRITPAYAGKRWSPWTTPARKKDHPRVCGEKARNRYDSATYKGSPPRMRGKEASDGQIGQVKRITPAHAGKSLLRWSALPEKRDHPRACGEKLKFPLAIVSPTGSPPRMRGKGRCCGLEDDATGITPAYAGKRTIFVRPSQCNRDHPRVCGEKIRPRATASANHGSPPRMRGKALGDSLAGVRGGITPAYAGKRRNEGVILWIIRDHPRVCGEKTKKIP